MVVGALFFRLLLGVSRLISECSLYTIPFLTGVFVMFLSAPCYYLYPPASPSGSSYHQAFAGILFKMLCVPAWEMLSHDMGQSVLLLSVSGSKGLDMSVYCRASRCPPFIKEVGDPTGIGAQYP